MKTINISLDAASDLFIAGYDNDDETVNLFVAAYRDAAEKLGKAAGIEIAVVTPTSPADDDDTAIWQAIHNCVTPTDPELKGTSRGVDENQIAEEAAWIRQLPEYQS